MKRIFIEYTLEAHHRTGGSLGTMYIGQVGYADRGCFSLEKKRLLGIGGLICKTPSRSCRCLVKRVDGGFMLDPTDVEYDPDIR